MSYLCEESFVWLNRVSGLQNTFQVLIASLSVFLRPLEEVLIELRHEGKHSQHMRVLEATLKLTEHIFCILLLTGMHLCQHEVEG